MRQKGAPSCWLGTPTCRCVCISAIPPLPPPLPAAPPLCCVKLCWPFPLHLTPLLPLQPLPHRARPRPTPPRCRRTSSPSFTHHPWACPEHDPAPSSCQRPRFCCSPYCPRQRGGRGLPAAGRRRRRISPLALQQQQQRQHLPPSQRRRKWSPRSETTRSCSCSGACRAWTSRGLQQAQGLLAVLPAVLPPSSYCCAPSPRARRCRGLPLVAAAGMPPLQRRG